MSPIRYHEFPASAAEAGHRLDQVLGSRPGCSRSLARRLIDAGAVFVDGRRVKRASLILSAGQQVRAPTALPERVGPQEPIPVLLREAGLLAVIKPVGVPSAPTPLGERGCLPALLAEQLGLRETPIVVHRLDVDVSGVIVLAENRAAARMITAWFTEGRTEKIYHALVRGAPPSVEGEVAAPLGRDPARRGRMRVHPAGDPALTGWRVLREVAGVRDATELEVRLHTGRTHQIRVHLAHLGCPLLGDRWYGGPGSVVAADGRTIAVPRLCLHAHRLRVQRPGATPLDLVAEVPDFLGLGPERA
jgi:RluA family pseudouridine synthase